MTTLNARANQAWHEWLASEAGDGMEPAGAYVFEEGWETGYKTALADLEQDRANMVIVTAKAIQQGQAADREKS